MHQSDDSLDMVIPNTPLRTVEFSQRMPANPTIHNPLRELLKIGKSHRDVEPIQHVLSERRNLPLNSSQACVAIRKNGDRSSSSGAALPQRTTHRAHLVTASPAHESKAGRMPFAIQRFASNNLAVSFRPRVPISHISTVEADNQFLACLCRRSNREDFRRLLKTPAHLHRPVAHAARCCLRRQSRSSPMKSATFPNGNNAAIFAVRYRNSGVIGFLFVNNIEKLRSSDPEQEHPRSRRIRIPTRS
jgi:hypothetical protein